MTNRQDFEEHFLEKDLITNGVISNLIEKYIQYGSEYVVTKSDLIKIHKVLFSGAYLKTSGKYAKEIVIPIKSEKSSVENNSIDIEINENIEKLIRGITDHINNISRDDDFKYFEKDVVLFEDRMYGAAFGRFDYFYRAKGDRIFWSQEGKISCNNIYVTIDEGGFHYSGDYIMAEIDLNVEDDDLDIGMDSNFNSIIYLLRNLLKIKEHFYRDYALEYVVTPPDVDEYSEFSIILKEELWKIVMDYGNELIDSNNQDLERFEKLCTMFIELGVSPSPVQIFDFALNVNKSKNKVIEVLLNSIKAQSSKEEEVFESVFRSCLLLQANAGEIINKSENNYNTYLARLLESRRNDLTIKDQTLRGISNAGKAQGEVDIFIEKDGLPISVVEALVLKYLDKSYITTHQNKIWKYDTSGNRENFVIVYYFGNDFQLFGDNYYSFLSDCDKFTHKVLDVTVIEKNFTYIKVINTIWDVAGTKASVKHILIKI